MEIRLIKYNRFLYPTKIYSSPYKWDDDPSNQKSMWFANILRS